MKPIEVSTSRVLFSPVVSEKYNATWVGDFFLESVGQVAGVYYQKEPPRPDYSNYFGLFVRDNKVYITSAKEVDELTLFGAIAENGEVIYSRHRHDYRMSADSSVWIDGGRDYIRCPVGANIVEMKVVDGKFYQVENESV